MVNISVSGGTLVFPKEVPQAQQNNPNKLEDHVSTKGSFVTIIQKGLENLEQERTLTKTPVSENPERQFYQSTVPMDQRVTEPEAVGVPDPSVVTMEPADKKVDIPQAPEVTKRELLPQGIRPESDIEAGIQQDNVIDWKMVPFNNELGKVINSELRNQTLSQSLETVFGSDRASAIDATIQAESGGELIEESFNYTRASAKATFNSKYHAAIDNVFDNNADPNNSDRLTQAGQVALANAVYGGRMENSENEGYTYRGRGYIQISGKSNYRRIGEIIGEDLVSNPDLLLDPEIARKATIAYFYLKKEDSPATNIFSNLNATKLSKIIGHATDTADERWRSSGLPESVATLYEIDSSLRPKVRAGRRDYRTASVGEEGRNR